MKILFIFVFALLCIASTPAYSFDDCRGSCVFVLKNHQTNAFTVTDKARANKRMTPFSTFKIANSLIALETQVVTGLDQPLAFDKTKYPRQNWWPKIWYEKPLVIRNAFQNSAVPVYRQIATEIGVRRMKSYLAAFDYGNQDISSGIDTFWLGQSLEISAIEQVNFLQKLYTNQLNVSDTSLQKMMKIMVVEQTDDYTLYAKTGAGGTGNNSYMGWYVGFVKRGETVTYFALNMDGTSFKQATENRIPIARRYLKKAGIL